MTYKFVRFDKGQFDDYLTFVKKYRKDDPPNFWDLRHKWRIFDNRHAGSFFFAHADGEIAATLSISARHLTVKGRVLYTVELGDGWTAENHRQRGLFFKLGTMAKEVAFTQTPAEVVFGAPNPQAEPNWRKHRFVFTRDDDRQLIIIPSVRGLALRKARVPGADRIQHRRRFEKLRRSPFTTMAELPLSEYEAQTARFPRMNHVDDEYLAWRFGASPDDYRYFLVADGADRFHCTLRTTHLGRLPFLVVSEHFLNGRFDRSEKKLLFLPRIADYYYRSFCGIYLNAGVAPSLAGYLQQARYRFLRHRRQRVCFFFRDGFFSGRERPEDLVDDLYADFQLSDCDVG